MGLNGEMRYVRLKEVLPGALLGKEIFSVDGQILLREGASLTTLHLKRLKKFGIDVLPLRVPKNQTKAYDHLHVYMTNLKMIVEEKSSDWKKRFETLFQQVIKDPQLQESLAFLKGRNDSIYVHSLSVAFLSTSIGFQLGYKEKDLERLIRAALLHDVGKVVSHHYTQKGVPLGHDHTWKGYNYLQSLSHVDQLAALVALTHHETVDGSGYPRQLKSHMLHDITQIVSIANVYDQLTHQRNIKSLMHPSDALEFMLAFSSKRFNPLCMAALMECVALFPTGSQVILSNGEVGTVVAQNRGLPHRPIVKLIYINQQNEDELNVETVDLAKMLTLFVTQFVS
ncbi:HD domain-containing phosphohydrolase [Shouchella sp. 1P09AA]|uniref:HD-GYP domain-containing protein n=1 Tax=unclassified Shouchella TaxID=2893065 RepID=UPI0039A3B157